MDADTYTYGTSGTSYAEKIVNSKSSIIDEKALFFPFFCVLCYQRRNYSAERRTSSNRLISCRTYLAVYRVCPLNFVQGKPGEIQRDKLHSVLYLLTRDQKMTNDTMKEDKAKQELKSAEELHRFEASMMLGQSAVYLFITGTLLGAIADKDIETFNGIAIAIFGILLSLAFMFIAYRTGINLRGARNRAEELGEQLGFKLYSPIYRAQKNKFLVGKNVTKFICLIGTILWIMVLLRILFV
jgi:hypothetical protein